MELMTAILAVDVVLAGFLVARALDRICDQLGDIAYRLPYAGSNRIAEDVEEDGGGDTRDR